MTSQDLGSSTTAAVAASDSSMLVVPLGATEQHGPHLPLDTDTRIAVALSCGIAARRPDAAVAPPVNYGSSGEHQDFAGTLSIGQEALELLLVELVRSSRQTFGSVLFACGHGGNAVPVGRAVERLRVEGHRVGVIYPRWPPSVIDGPLDAHAGRVETSLMLHLAPDTVDLDQATRGTVTPIGEVLDTLRREGMAAVAPSGVLGDPTGASAAEGQRLLVDLVERSVAGLDDVFGS